MKNDNRGLSLVEVVIVLAIMAVLGTVVSVGVNLVTRKPADQCASRLQTVLQNNRMTTMG